MSTRWAATAILFAACQAGALAQACGNTSRDFGTDGSANEGGANEGGFGAAVTGISGDDFGLPDGGSSRGGSTSSAAGAAGVAQDGGGAGMAGDSSLGCGNAKLDPGEECDLGADNSADAYGTTACTDQCKKAPYCGDSKKNGTEACDDGGSTTNLGSCNPVCSGYYEKKFLRLTYNLYAGGALGDISSADDKCVLEFGAGWKALLVGGGRRATLTPLLGDGAKDWVIHKYTHYYSYHANALVWRTDDVALLGVRDGQRVNVYSDAFSGQYPWSGWKSDWTTFPDNTPNQGTCASWTSTLADWGSFALANLTAGASETCDSSGPLLCVEQ